MRLNTTTQISGLLSRLPIWQLAVICFLCVSVTLWLTFHPRAIKPDAGQQRGAETQTIQHVVTQPASRPRPRVNMPTLPGTAVRTLSSEKFRARYSARVERSEVESVLHTLEDVRIDVERRTDSAAIHTSAASPVDVLIHDTTADFVAATGQPWWAAAVTHDNLIELQPLEILRSRGVLNQTLRHEYTHSVIEALSHGHAPRWLEEGLAAHIAGEGAMLEREHGNEEISVDELERRLTQPASPEDMRLLYAAAYREVSALIRAEGEASVWRRLAAS